MFYFATRSELQSASHMTEFIDNDMKVYLNLHPIQVIIKITLVE
jgi:hypothetical protein